ncbi:hypothetical protein DOTSEDRAFT_69786 [Dothistroma septosporum NZE10]|uniref:Uncharacterized protein n=1 Tax=Dothistroma septosporum (strain NZE10 / CBS 128990) TaxID=675120 RepID=N1Q0G3_DOTSN|nr:hypothetical protein DOTSEDRAFT_69786 [Dothistroma septosporum NZE10]
MTGFCRKALFDQSMVLNATFIGLLPWAVPSRFEAKHTRTSLSPPGDFILAYSTQATLSPTQTDAYTLRELHVLRSAGITGALPASARSGIFS